MPTSGAEPTEPIVLDTSAYARLEALAEFLDEPFVHAIDVDSATARRYGALVGALRRAGTPIPANDVWIAAVAMGTDGQLVTFDGDFAHVPGLRYQLLR